MRYCSEDAPRTGERNVNLNKNTSENAASNKTLVLDAMYDKFINIIKLTIEEHAPTKIASQKRQKLLERFWITWGLLDSIKRKQKMFRLIFCLKMKT